MREFSKNWKTSKKPKKQRKYRAKAPLHIKQKFVSVHLSKELRKKFQKRNLHVRKGDTVIVLRGQFRGKNGKVEKVDLKSSRVYITGMESTKKDGSKALYPFTPSNLMIKEIFADDKKRMKKLKSEQK